MDAQELRETMLYAILSQGTPLAQAMADADAAVRYVLGEPKSAPTAPKRRKDVILDLWAQGVIGSIIAEKMGMKTMAVLQVVGRARKAGDERAGMRRASGASQEKRRANLAAARAKLAAMRAGARP